MSKKTHKNTEQVNNLYNNIVTLSRNKLFYTKLGLNDTFQNRINLIFIHISFLFAKIKSSDDKNLYKDFYQESFDLIFKRIEINMRELGYGDTLVNKNMKYLVKNFYNILLNCEAYSKKKINSKISFFTDNLEPNPAVKSKIGEYLVDYFDKFEAFCLDLTIDSVLKGSLNFKYN